MSPGQVGPVTDPAERGHLQDTQGWVRFVDATRYISDVSNGDSFLPIQLHGVWIEFSPFCFPPTLLVTIAMAT